MPDRDWRDEVIDAATAAGLKASRDMPDSVLIADARNLAEPGGQLDMLADSLAADLRKHAAEPITQATCLALVRAACDLQGLTLLSYTSREILTVLGVAAAKLEMQVPS